MRKQKFLSLFFLFSFFLVLKLGSGFIAGSTYELLSVEKCEKINISLVCSDKIEEDEFYFFPNCHKVRNEVYNEYWVCDCSDSYTLKFHINQASNNSCNLFINYVYSIEMPPERRSSSHTREVIREKPIVNKTVINRTIIQPERIVYLNITNKSLEEELEQLKKALNRSIKESLDLKKKIEDYIKRETYAMLASLVVIIAFIYWMLWGKRKQKNI